MESWKQVSQINIEGSDVKVTKYKAPSGLTLVVIDSDGPLVHTNIILATEYDDDDGSPHNLEHLIFHGSEDYPYKELIHTFGNQCYSNLLAWTDLACTYYMLSSVGPEGTLRMLPIYMDHILYPLLTDESFLTEVHHVNGKGEDGGVVYAERQSNESDPFRQLWCEVLKELYPGHAYSYNYSGTLENLRNSTSIEKIRKYHHNYYRPENITIVIAGHIASDSVIEALESVEDKIKKKNEQTPPLKFVRPWQRSLPPLTATKVIHCDYPSVNEDFGRIYVGFRGPPHQSSEGYYEYIACDILLDHVYHVLANALIDVENPFAKNVITEIFEKSIPLMRISLEDVPLARIDSAISEFQNCIHSLASSTEFLQIEGIKALIESKIESFQLGMAMDTEYELRDLYMYDMLYSINEQQFSEKLNMIPLLKNLEKENLSWWQNLYKTYLLQDFVGIVGRPSRKLLNELIEEESKRVKAQKDSLGENGLKTMAEILNNAIKFNDKEVPIEVKSSVFVPNIDNLKKFNIEVWNSNSEDCPYFNIRQLPFYTHVQNINSHFSYITLLMNTSVLEMKESFYLPLLLNVIPQAQTDQINTTYHLNIEFGIHEFSMENLFYFGTYYNTITMNAWLNPEKYEQSVNYLWHILKKGALERKIVLIAAENLLNIIAQFRNDGEFMTQTLIQTLTTKKNSNLYSTSILQQENFLSKAVSILKKEDSDESVSFLNSLENVRSKLTQNDNICLHFSANLNKYQHTPDPWRVFGSFETTYKTCSVQGNSSYLEQIANYNEIEGQGCIVGMKTVKASNLILYSQGPVSFADPDLPALQVAMNYMETLAGPMWKTIRGEGLAYSYHFELNPLNGSISFVLNDSNDVVQAYEKTKALIEQYFSINTWDEELLMSAKNSLIFKIIRQESTKTDLIRDTLKNLINSVDSDYNQTLCKAIAAVTKEEVFNAAKKWFPAVFSTKSPLVITCNPSKVDEIKHSFDSMGHSNLKVYKTLEESHLQTESFQLEFVL